MRFAAITLVGLMALAASAELASARDGCGRGRYWNGYTCAPDPYYAPPVVGPGYGGGYYRPYVRQRSVCPPNWTVQGGVCKPYRGY